MSRKLQPNKRRAPARANRRSIRPEAVRIQLGRLGSRAQTIEIPIETTVGDLVKAEGLEQASIRINRKPVRLSARFDQGDIIVAVPRSIEGGSGGRHDHLDLDACRRTMSSEDFNFFVRFVGADALGFKDEDLDPS